MAAEALVGAKVRAPTIPESGDCKMLHGVLLNLSVPFEPRRKARPHNVGPGGFSQRISADSGFPVLPGARRLRSQPATGSGVPGIFRERASPVMRELRAACEGNDRHRVGQSAFWS